MICMLIIHWPCQDKDYIRHVVPLCLVSLLSFQRRSFYVLHYWNFQLYMRMGMKVMAIHSALAFRQAPYMKSYVNMNAEKRAETTNKFNADFYKLSVNSLFGK